jgi:hypothetical protein
MSVCSKGKPPAKAFYLIQFIFDSSLYMDTLGPERCQAKILRTALCDHTNEAIAARQEGRHCMYKM